MEKSPLKDHNLFKPQSFEEGRHAVVGDCNGFTMEERWKIETPLFAGKISALINDVTNPKILDYGCGVGRMAKAVLTQPSGAYSLLTGTDASPEMLSRAVTYVNDPRFNVCLPHELKNPSVYDLVYLIYVLQHVPAIEIRDVLERIHWVLKGGGFLVYCSSDYRMAIRYDGKGFFDDRFLGVDLRAEVERLFVPAFPLFTEQDLNGNPLLAKMINGADGGLAHPAIVYRPRLIDGELFNMRKGEEKEDKTEQKKQEIPSDIECGSLNPICTNVKFIPCVSPSDPVNPRMGSASWETSSPKKVLIINRLAPGDILVMTNALRDLHLAHPGKYLTDVRSPCNEIFENSPYITKLQYPEGEYSRINHLFQAEERKGRSPYENVEFIGDILVFDAQYPMIHRSGTLGAHFGEGHRECLEQALNITIPQTDIRPQIFLSQGEKDWPSPALVKAGVQGNAYWVINAGSKNDMSLKQYPYYQEVVDLLGDKITFVQVGQKQHNHQPLRGVVDMVGQTSVRELMRTIYHAAGVISCVSFPMHIAAAFNKPCVVVAGGREGTRWELYPNHQFLYVNGCLQCAPYDGCWRNKPQDCNNKKNNIPRCMLLIRPQDVAWAVMRYYEGGAVEGPYLSTIGQVWAELTYK